MGEVAVGQTSVTDLPLPESEHPATLINVPRHIESAATLGLTLGLPSPAFSSLGLPSPAAGEPLSKVQNVFASNPPATAISDPLLEQQTLPGVAPIAADSEADNYFGATEPSNPIPCVVDTTIPLSSPPVVKASHSLRLPSFDLLGIATPHPDRISCNPERLLNVPDLPRSAESIGGGGGPNLLDISKPTQGEASSTAWFHASSPQRTLRRSTNNFPLTPPDDIEAVSRVSLTHAMSTAMQSPSINPNESQSTEESGGIEGSVSSPQEIVYGMRSDMEPWIEEVANLVVSTFNTESIEGNSFRILSHALPCPSSPGHAFPNIIQAIHQCLPPNPTTWINVCHAVHGRFNLADLPTSPPSTPGPAFGGQDYFTTKIFDTAVPISDYSIADTPITSTPKLVVPPSSINMAIVERYIPPTSAHEFSGLFNIRGPSLLVDRLVELSPNGGSLIFVYPTRKGAHTFMNDYLGPILDPLLRSMAIVNGFSSDLSLNLGRMVSVPELPVFSSMQRNIEALCRQLSQAGDLIHKSPYVKTKFKVIYSKQQEIQLSREHWATWFVKQEKPRIRAVIGKYFRLAKKLPADADVMPTNLIEEILDGVISRPYPQSEPPKQGIEIGAFVIRRSIDEH